ncbi:hypothetical protein ZIOFF_061296 [Zingiber officinale]|uniref:Uncharacterized protein n=1 Tax=Zingiber officinale TaxID=94328 RepID=A0A8J5F3U2_ZINOF|nr:hypothetical protein ZIOFF_061296 [Zingiber officinale]
MSSALDATRAELALLVLYLNKAEARDQLCRAIQFDTKFLSNGERLIVNRMLIKQLARPGDCLRSCFDIFGYNCSGCVMTGRTLLR